jgi:hypothetical protein
MRVKDTRARKLTVSVNFLVDDAVGKGIFMCLSKILTLIVNMFP